MLPQNIFRRRNTQTARQSGPRVNLLTKTKLRDKGGITRAINFLEIIEKRTTLVDHLEKTTTRMIVLVVIFKMGSQAIDTVSQDCNLHFW